MLPSAAGFVDPLLSTGFPLTLLGVGRLAEIIERKWETDEFQPALEEYAIRTRNDLLAASRLVAGLYASMNDFEMFSSLSKLYFAAVIYSEAVRRLGRPHLAGSFLMHEHEVFGPKLRDISERAVHPMSPIERRSLIEEINRAIEPFDVAGLSDHSRKNWYPVIAEDLLGNAGKVGADRGEIERMLERSGFWQQYTVEVR
jgi:FADH2 O2-dependent halogenase